MSIGLQTEEQNMIIPASRLVTVKKNGDIKQHFKECPDLRLQTASHEHMNWQRIFISIWDHFYSDIWNG